jgi:type VI secretion system secreted protein Hcp
MSIYVKFGAVKGSATAEGYKDQFEVYSISWGDSRNIGTSTGSTGGRNPSTPAFQDFQMSKGLDLASNDLFLQSVSMAATDTVVISHVRTDEAGPQLYLEYTLYNVLISSYSVGGSGDDRPQENLSLNFSKIQIKYVPEDETGKAGTPKTITYDLTLHKKV